MNVICKEHPTAVATVAVAIALVVGLALGGCSRDQPSAVPQPSMAGVEDPPPAATASVLKDVSQLDSRKLASDPETWPGAAVFRSSCASCHSGQIPKAPSKVFLQMLSGPTILESLDKGLMLAQAQSLSPQQKQAVAEYLSGATLAAQTAERPLLMCGKDVAPFASDKRPAMAGWGYNNSRFVPGDTAGVAASDASRLKLKWAFQFPNAIRARSQPSIAFGAVFVGSHDGHVYALDLATGCARWTFKAGAEVRTAVVPYEAPRGPGLRAMPPRVYFGDVLGRAYSLDAATGALRWSAKLDDHPNATLTGTGTYDDGMIYQPVSSLEVTSAADSKYECCTFRGSVVALDAWNGEQRWKSYTIRDAPQEIRKTSAGTRVLGPSGAPVWNSPMVDRKRGVLYVGTGQNYSSPANDRSNALLALRLKDGSLAWSQQMLKGDAWNVGCMMKDNPNCPTENGPDVDFGAGTILARTSAGKDILIAGQKNGYVYALDVDAKGVLLWKTRVGRGGIQGGVHFGMAQNGDRVWVPISDMKDGHDGRPVDGPPRPGLYALGITDGKLLWAAPADDVCGKTEFCDPGISAAITATPGLVFAGHMDGRFRAYDAENGKVLFEYDARQEVPTVGGGRARGGSFGGAGAAVRDGYVVVNSGYGLYFHMPGNVLLAFSAN